MTFHFPLFHLIQLATLDRHGVAADVVRVFSHSLHLERLIALTIALSAALARNAAALSRPTAPAFAAERTKADVFMVNLLFFLPIFAENVDDGHGNHDKRVRQ